MKIFNYRLIKEREYQYIKRFFGKRVYYLASLQPKAYLSDEKHGTFYNPLDVPVEIMYVEHPNLIKEAEDKGIK